MGYDLHITRKEDWSDEEGGLGISLEEWLRYIHSDPDLELSDAYRIKVPGSKTESQVAPGFCEWTAHVENSRPFFDYSNGNISTKNPDDDTIRKMISISNILNAKVQGDDGELYDESYFKRQAFDRMKSDKTYKKPWWKFW